MWIVQVALKRPYTFVVLALLIALFGLRSALLTPTDIFPNINIPVISVVWTYTGLLPNDMSGASSTTTSARSPRRSATSSTRIAVARRLRRRQDLLPEERRHRRRDGAGHRGLADGAEAPAARHHAALCALLQRLQRAHPAARAVEQEIARRCSCSIRARTSSVRSSPRSPAPRCPRPTAARYSTSSSISISTPCRSTMSPRRTWWTQCPRRT